MSNRAIVEQEWEPLCTGSPYEVPSSRPVLCMEHKKTKMRAYFDVKLDRFLTQHEVSMVMDGYDWLVK